MHNSKYNQITSSVLKTIASENLTIDNDLNHTDKPLEDVLYDKQENQTNPEKNTSSQNKDQANSSTNLSNTK